MTNTPKLSDADAFNLFVRAGQRKNKIEWTPTGDRQDVDDLNAAIRRAAGRGEQESDDKPFPWKSVAGDESEGT